MALPYFFADPVNQPEVILDEETSRHIVQVLRMQEGDCFLLTDGKGLQATAEIIHAHKKHCSARVIETAFTPQRVEHVTIAISLVKNMSRFEWFLEKATELGVREIIPLICERTERLKFRYDRMISICRSAMLQSMQTWLPVLQEPREYTDVVDTLVHTRKFIAHCAHDLKSDLRSATFNPPHSVSILIGPEGDFTASEISYAKEHDFLPVSLGNTRLRTETAGIYAAVMLTAR